MRIEDAYASAAGRRRSASTSTREWGGGATRETAQQARAENNVAAAAQAGGTRATGVAGFIGYRTPNVSGDEARQVPKSHHDRPPINSGRLPDDLICASANSWRRANPAVQIQASKLSVQILAPGLCVRQVSRSTRPHLLFRSRPVMRSRHASEARCIQVLIRSNLAGSSELSIQVVASRS